MLLFFRKPEILKLDKLSVRLHHSICGNRCRANLCSKPRCLPHYSEIQIPDKDTSESKVNMPYLLRLSHMMVNSETEGTSLSCTLCSCPLFRYLWIKRLAKDWSFPWAIFKTNVSVFEKECPQATVFQPRHQW